MSKSVISALKYGVRLIGTPYGGWSEDQAINSGEPFWAANVPPPNLSEITSCSCAGLINLIRRSRGLSIPGVDQKLSYPGGTYRWYEYFFQQDLLKSFDYHDEYPAGTLFLRNYQNEGDQGHLAILLEEGGLYSKLLQSNSPWMGISGVNADFTLGTSHFWKNTGYFSNFVLPKDWLY